MRFYFVTWNVASTCPEEDLHNLLGIKYNDQNIFPDFYVVGLQELKSYRIKDMLVDSLSEDPWSKLINETLMEYNYVKIQTRKLQGIVLHVFCLKQHKAHIKNIETKKTRTGFKGLWGNKGAVSIRFNLYDVSICIVNSHLAAHDYQVNDRISSYKTILKDQTFRIIENRSILDHNYVFWMGDLNFRLNGYYMTAEDIDKKVKKKEFDKLLIYDQLQTLINSELVFPGFCEGKIIFPPTHKFKIGHPDYSLKRRPSWTDRILYKVNAYPHEAGKLGVIINNYKCHLNYVQSDHKPVSAEIEIITELSFKK